MGRNTGYKGPDMTEPDGRVGLRRRLERQAETHKADDVWQRFCHEKSDPYDEAWGGDHGQD